MKSVAIILAICAAIAYAFAAAKDINALLERATDLEGQANKVIAEFHNHSKSHLVEGLNHELHNLERLAAHLKNLSATNATVRTHELNRIEEDLLHYENRFTEELEIALEVYHYNATGKNADELINYGTALIKLAKDELAKHPNHAHREVLAVELRIKAIERTIADLARHETGRRHDLDEVALFATELSLRALIQRLQHEDK